MGNKASLFITLDHGYDLPIVAGKSLKGKVVLNVQRKLPSGELVLRLVGTEYTIVPTRKGTKREERIIARAFTKLNGFGGTGRRIAKGLYSQPFEFLLPASLPSSTQFPKTECKNFHGRIQYRLSAEMGDFSVDRMFLVQSAPMGNNIVPCIAAPTTHELRQARLLKKGYLSVGACVDNSHVGRGQTMKVSICTRNDSLLNIDRVRISLKEVIEYKAQDETRVLKYELVEIKDAHLPGLQRSRSQEGLRVSKKRTPQTMSRTYAEMLVDLRLGENTVKITVPKTARDSYDGNLITISHFLKITFYTGGLTVENPTIKIALVIGSPRAVNPERSETFESNDIATVVGDDPVPSEIPNPSDTSTVSVGYDIPMAEARILPEIGFESPNTVYPLDENLPNGRARVLPYSSDDEEDEDNFIIRPMPIPSAPHESLLFQESPTTPPREIARKGNTHLDGPANRNQRSARHPYAPYTMYNSHNETNPDRNRERFSAATDNSVSESSAEFSYAHERIRERIDSYSYGETTAMSELTEDRPQLGHAQLPVDNTLMKQNRNKIFNRLLQELRVSIQDYEVVSGKTREAAYRDLYSSLTPKEFGQIIATVSMSYQVQVAVLLARNLVHTLSFTCAHCTEAVRKTSSYFRTNMVEALIPYAHDVAKNRGVIESELSEWERCVTARAFENLK